MPKIDENSLTLEALGRAIADPTPRPLVGTKAKPGIFIGGTQAIKTMAQGCVERGWIEATGQSEGQGRSKKPLYRITARGIAHALEHAPEKELLRDMLAALDGQTRKLERLQAEVAGAAELLRAQTQALKTLGNRSVPVTMKESSPVAWTASALQYLAEYRRRHPYGRCPLPELYQKTAAGQTIGQFHDGVRQLAADGKIALHPFTGAAYQLKDEQYALLAGQEIKYYVDLVATS